jgi:uncharacterized protein (TIGR02757 family)
MHSKKDIIKMREYLNELVIQFSRPSFIEDDPVGIPHLFNKKQDIEIAGFFAASFAWGQRKTIINKSRELLELMDMCPYAFVMQHEEVDLLRFRKFRHRTFQYTDTLFFIDFLRRHYRAYDSLEDAFLLGDSEFNARTSLSAFHNYAFGVDYAPERSRKHLASPQRGSTCKRLNMYLRWMVRKDVQSIDFGLWDKIPTNALMIPLDVHVEKIARALGLLTRKSRDWLAVEELTKNLSLLDSEDPVKYDFALFGLGVIEKRR